MTRWRKDLEAALSAAGPASFAYRRSAAALHRLDGHTIGEVGFPRVPEIAVRYPRAARGDAARLRNLVDADIVLVAGTPATCIGRTLVDLGTSGSADLVERAVESAIRFGLVTDPQMRRIAAQRDLHGVRRLRIVMDRRPEGAPPTGSDAETLCLQLCRRAGLPELDRQHPPAPGSTYRIDLAWPAWRIAIEVDGRVAHGDDQFVNDRRRGNTITLTPWTLLRFTWDDIVGSPERTLHVLERALRLAGWPGHEPVRRRRSAHSS